jgi:twitching motility two-component system response regulator PilH
MDREYKMLVVDDYQKALLRMEAVLKPYGYDVVLVNDGRHMIRTARKEKPDLILLDIMMPRPDGYTILNTIKKETTLKNIPVVMVTALGLDDNKAFAGICGAYAYITKPINSKLLIETITQFLPNSTS